MPQPTVPAPTGPGLFLTLEGGDGSGKSTQSALLTDWLTAQGRTVVHSREPGGTEMGLQVRETVLHFRGHIAPRAEALLYAADRAHNIATVVRPALERGDIVRHRLVQEIVRAYEDEPKSAAARKSR